MRLENSTLDKYISSIFNLNNVNPTYIFRLPDKSKKNRTIVLRKSDFTSAVFPNVTNVNKFTSTTRNLEASSSSKHSVKAKNEDLEELKHERLIFENNVSNNYDDYDDSSMKHIVDENVRSEQEFIRLMNDLNEDLNEEDFRQNYQQKLIKKPTGKKSARQKSEEEQWDELGLSGWSGNVAGSKDQLPKKQKFEFWKTFLDLRFNEKISIADTLR